MDKRNVIVGQFIIIDEGNLMATRGIINKFLLYVSLLYLLLGDFPFHVFCYWVCLLGVYVLMYFWIV
jgi:hypothetical protein